MSAENSHSEGPDHDYATQSDNPASSQNASGDPDPFATEMGDETPSAAALEDGNHVTQQNSRERFRKLRPHASGGLGRVWVAEDTEINRSVALKEILPAHADDARSRHRFVREAEITGALEHPGIVPVYGLGIEDDGRPFYAMRMIEGTTLKETIEELHRNRPSTAFRNSEWRSRLRNVLARFIVVCETIAYTHSRGVIHRDIKPSNIMLGDFGETIVVDWGLAKQLESPNSSNSGPADDVSSPLQQDQALPHNILQPASSKEETPQQPVVCLSDSRSSDTDNLTMQGVAIGTPAYMSPEQASGNHHAIGPASDIYSLGASLFQLLTGEPPSGGSEVQNEQEKATEWESRLELIPNGLAAICRKALSSQPNARYADATQLAVDLENWLNDRPLNAYSESKIERSLRWIRSHPTLATTSCVVAVLSLVGSLVAFGVNTQHQWELLQQEQEQQSVERESLNRIQSIVSEARASAKTEIRNSRFEAAVEFLDSAITQAEKQPELRELLPELQAMLDRTQRLLDFYHYVDIAEELTFTDHSRRSSVLFQRALTILGVFERREWWNALPTEDLDEHQIHRLREQTYRAMFLLAALRLKETIPADLNVSEMLQLANSQSKESNLAAQLLFDQLDAYRPSQGSVLGRMFATERVRLLTQMLQGIAFRQKVISWDPKNMADLYVMGTALAYMAINTTPQQRSSFEAILGIKDAAIVSEGMLDSAASLAPDHYWTQMVRGFFEAQRREADFAERSYSHAVALQPNRWIGYAWRGRDRMEQTLKYDREDPEVARILQRSLRDLEKAMDLNPNESLVHFHQGLLSAFGGAPISEVTTNFLLAFELQEPTESMSDSVVENIARHHMRQMCDWCESQIPNEGSSAELNACLALGRLRLGELQAAGEAARKALTSEATEATGQFVLAWLAFHNEDDGTTANHLARAQNLAPERFYLWDLQAKLDSKNESWPAALTSCKRARATAKTSWQLLVAQTGILRASMQLKDSDQVEIALKDLLDEPLTDRLDTELQLAIDTGYVDVAESIERYHKEISPVVELNDQSPIQQLPLLNGSFELGISNSWGDELARSDQPVWQTHEGFVASARVGYTIDANLRSSDIQSDPGRALHIESSSTKSEGAFAEMFQSVPAMSDETYVLKLRALSRGGSGSEVQILVESGGSESQVLSIPSGQNTWQTLSRTFRCSSDSITIRIQCFGPADVWLDDLELYSSKNR